MKKEFVFEHDYNNILRREALSLIDGGQTRVLNIACEFNLVPAFLQGLVSPNDVYGVEINEEVIKNNDHIRFCDVDRDPLPFDPVTFDLVLSIWGIEHFETDNIFRQAARVLKKGGHMVFLTPNIVNPLFLLNKVSKGWASHVYFKHLTDSKYRPHQTHYNFNKASTVSAAAERCGLKLTKVVYFGPSFFTKYFEFNKFLESAVVTGDRMITNPVLGFFKPYLICILENNVTS